MRNILDNTDLRFLLFVLFLFFALLFTKESNALPLWIIKEEIIQQDIKFPEVVFAQAILETGWSKCQNCALDKFNNVFGFTTSLGFIRFSNWRSSIRFYRLWQNKYYKGGDYFEFLSRSWGAPDMPLYIRKLKSVITRTK
jgi:hypothetical protein